MKTFLVSLLFVVAAAATAATAQEHPKTHDAHDAHKAHDAAKVETATDVRDGDVIKRGVALNPESPAVAFADVLKEPVKFVGKRVRIEGIVEQVCQAEGCWMQITPQSGTTGIRVTFKDHKFIVPKDSKSMKFKAEGEFFVKTLDKAQVDHLVEDGAKIERKADGTADEIRFVATGVELRK
ncbi:MAG TPA: DUF4920 domain-containing protein [Pyrinomonadaceae bacterium]|jgi:Ni/Co efflux regulator RcnB|nr:DUF4920 domain-containing protein [Pyrinomonadaceae bacterium]